ncbi:MAG: hypothetical protein J6Q54_09080 [Oscillospiraceae bacterium]|nr:hypothetical protein [Oscillospiraceae bacterium]
MKYVLFAAQLILLAIIAVLFLQIKSYLNKLPEDEVLGEEATHYIKKRLTGITICICVVIFLSLLESVLRFL